MLSDWFKKLQEELDALTEMDLKRVGINLRKPDKEDIFIGQLSEELQKLWTLIGRKEKEVRRLTYEHSKECKQKGSEDCKTFSEKCLIIIEDVGILEKMFQAALRRELAAEQKSDIARSGVYLSKDFKLYSQRRKISGFPFEMIEDVIGIMGLMKGGGILIEL